MADLAYETSAIATLKISWGAIWAGMVTFIAIWSVFGLLGVAIFASAANPAAQHPVTGMSVGMGIWAVVLTIIAMYVAGRETARLAAVTNRHDGLIHGMILFGLSVVAALLITILAGTSLNGGAGVSDNAHSPYLFGVFSDLGWMGLFSLFLGWLAAMGGASAGAGSRRAPQPEVSSTQADASTRIRPAA
jgi:hypothetical protein